MAPNHISKRHPDWVVKYDTNLWLDPGKSGVNDYVKSIIKEILDNYDVDGIHFDDYYYPYKKAKFDFPDKESYTAYLNNGGKLNHSDWQRDNINRMIKEVNELINSQNKGIKFGVSPFGIWKSGTPEGVVGLSSYHEIGCDSRLWLQKGWIDYMVPQVYWRIDSERQPYGKILDWWVKQNTNNRHLYAGNDIPRSSLDTKTTAIPEIVQEVLLSRQLGSLGNTFFSMKTFTRKNSPLISLLNTYCYAHPALPPTMNWKSKALVSRPENVTLKTISTGKYLLQWDATQKYPVMGNYWWAVYKQGHGKPILLSGSSLKSTVIGNTFCSCERQIYSIFRFWSEPNRYGIRKSGSFFSKIDLYTTLNN